MNLVLQLSVIAAMLQAVPVPGPIAMVPTVVEASLAFAGWGEESDRSPSELRIVLKYSSFAEEFAKLGVDLDQRELIEALGDHASVELSEDTPWWTGESCPADNEPVIWVRIVDLERIPTGYEVRVWYHFPQEDSRSDTVLSGFASFGLSLTWENDQWSYQRIGRHYRS